MYVSLGPRVQSGRRPPLRAWPSRSCDLRAARDEVAGSRQRDAGCGQHPLQRALEPKPRHFNLVRRVASGAAQRCGGEIGIRFFFSKRAFDTE